LHLYPAPSLSLIQGFQQHLVIDRLRTGEGDEIGFQNETPDRSSVAQQGSSAEKKDFL